jgi:hypothetical protein
VAAPIGGRGVPGGRRADLFNDDPVRRRAARAFFAAAGLVLALAVGPAGVASAGPLQPAIVGGGPISVTEAPWQVKVEEIIPVAGQAQPEVFVCGGSILSATKILTAAHCVFNESKEVPAGDLLVTAGTSDFNLPELATEQRGVSAVRVHPDYAPNPAPTEDVPDDVAVLTLSAALELGPAVEPIALATAGSLLPEGMLVNESGFGEEIPHAELSGALNAITMNLVSSRDCGQQADALFVCARSAKGSVCFGDSGSGLTIPGSPATPGVDATPVTLVGVTDTTEEKCAENALAGFANVTAPEIWDFIEGDETPPLAPRGGGSTIVGTPELGQSLTCDPGTWSGSPTFTYVFINSANGQILQTSSSTTYSLSAADVGRAILCEVRATNPGGTGIVHTGVMTPIKTVLPVVESVAPSEGPAGGGTVVKIKGKGFLMGATVTIGAAATEPKFVSSTELTAKAPVGSGSQKVVVTDEGGTSVGGPTFAYLAAPTVESITPAEGPTGGGTDVKIKGKGFVAGASVTIGAAATEVKFVSGTELTAKTPAGSGSQKAVVSDAGGTSTGGPVFAYIPAPTVESISPGEGPSAGGTLVTIKGKGFVGGATVTIGAAATETKFVSSTALTARTPAGSGSQRAVVTDAGGTSAGGPIFAFLPVPTVESITPKGGPPGGGTVVTIKGNGFVAGATVTIGAAATEIKFVSSTELTARTPAGSGSQRVVVTDAGGASTGGPMFGYLAAPTVESITPNEGPASGGTLVKIKGDGFLLGATVTVGGAATEVSFVSSTELTARAPAGSGSRSVVVTDEGGVSTDGPTFAYVQAPTVESISPAEGPAGGGTLVTIRGKGFVAGATVTIGGAATEVRLVSATELTARTPAGSGAPEVTVSDTGGTSTGGPTFTYAAVSTTSVQPASPGFSSIGTTIGGLPLLTPQPVGSPTSGAANVSLAGAIIVVQGSGRASVKVTCRGSASCHGKLTLTAKSSVLVKGKQTVRTVPIGTASFAIPGGGSRTIQIKLGPVGRGLLATGHGRLSARLAIVKVEPAPRQSQVKTVQLVAQKGSRGAK